MVEIVKQPDKYKCTICGHEYTAKEQAEACENQKPERSIYPVDSIVMVGSDDVWAPYWVKSHTRYDHSMIANGVGMNGSKLLISNDTSIVRFPNDEDIGELRCWLAAMKATLVGRSDEPFAPKCAGCNQSMKRLPNEDWLCKVCDITYNPLTSKYTKDKEEVNPMSHYVANIAVQPNQTVHFDVMVNEQLTHHHFGKACEVIYKLDYLADTLCAIDEIKSFCINVRDDHSRLLWHRKKVGN